MKCVHDRSNTLALMCAFLLIALFPMSGCAGEVERRWSEEVEIGDGKIIEVDRYVKFSESNSVSGDAYSSTARESTLNFKGEFAGVPTWSVPLVPILLYHDATTAQWVIVATTSNCDTWYERGGPVPPYWEYRLSADKWTQSPLSESSKGRKTNLFFDYEPDLPEKKISASLKRQVIQRNSFAKKYLSIEGGLKSRCGYAPPQSKE